MITKKCLECLLIFSLEKMKIGKPYCVPCYRKRDARYCRKYREKNKDNQEYVDRAAAARRAWKRNQKEKIVSFYSKGKNCCECCGEKMIEFLTIDHIIPISKLGIKRFNGTLYTWIKKNDFPSGLQVLCYNCNYGKKDKEKCPHKH